MYFIELIGFIQYYGVLKRPFLKECVPKKCREIYAQIPPQVGFVPPHLYPPYGGGHIPPHGKISMANPGIRSKSRPILEHSAEQYHTQIFKLG